MLKRMIKILISVIYHAGDSFIRYVSRSCHMNDGDKLVVLTYHAVKSHQKTKFARQMDQLLNAGIPVFADTGTAAGDHRLRIAVTFDDGYQSILSNALPALYERNIPSTIFIPTKFIGEKPEWIIDETNPNRLESIITEEQLSSLPPGLVKVGSHTHSHVHLDAIPTEALKEELDISRRTLERLLERKIDLMSLPYGSLNRNSLPQFKQSHYRLIFSNVPCSKHLWDEGLVGRTDTSPDDWNFEYYLKLRGSYQWMSIISNIKNMTRRFSVFLNE